MSQLLYTIDNEIFDLFPGYCRGVVLAFDIENGDSPPELTAMLRDAEASLRNIINKDEVATHPRINSWREAYRAFGDNKFLENALNNAAFLNQKVISLTHELNRNYKNGTSSIP